MKSTTIKLIHIGLSIAFITLSFAALTMTCVAARWTLGIPLQMVAMAIVLWLTWILHLIWMLRRSWMGNTKRYAAIIAIALAIISIAISPVLCKTGAI